MQFDTPVTAPFEEVRAEWIDFNGHLNMAYYNVLFDHAVDHLLAMLGCGEDYLRGRAMSLFTAEAHVCYLRELKAGDRARSTLQLVAHDEKRIRLYQELFHEDGWLSATSETLLLHIDMKGLKVTPFPPDIAAAVGALAEAHRTMDRPKRASRAITLGDERTATTAG